MSGEGVESRRATLRTLEAGLVEGDSEARARLGAQIGAFLSDEDWRVRKDAASVAARNLETAGSHLSSREGSYRATTWACATPPSRR